MTIRHRDLKREHCILQDGRKLCYILDVPQQKDSLPHFFLFHGMFARADDYIRKSPPTNYTLVCVDRPGYGGSSPVSTYSYQQFAKDIQELADHLKLDQFYVAGHSSGGPCALACGACMPDRVKGIAVISGDIEYALEGAPHLDRRTEIFFRYCIPCCLCVLSCGGICGFFSKRQHGAKTDYKLERELYPFSVESITQPTLIAVGDGDHLLPPAYSEFTKSRIEGAELVIIPGADHMSIVQQVHMDAIFSRLFSMTTSDEDEAAE